MKRRQHNLARAANAFLVTGCFALTQMSHAATVTGLVIDGTTGEPLSGVQVFADGENTGVVTDTIGSFRLDLAAGEKVFTLKKEGFSEQNLGKIDVAADGEQALPNAKLYTKPADDVVMLETLSVEGTLVKGSSGDLQIVRQKADVSIDFLSTEQIAKFSAGDAAEAIIRIPGVSVANGQFAVVRGLSDRFLSTTLHGLKLPSPDPEKQAFQMDLLPSSAIGSIIVSKTYSPELWGESGGGNIDVLTNAIPEENYVKLAAGLKANSNALDGGLDYSTGTSGERFGFGSSNRPSERKTPADWQYVPTAQGGFPLGTDFSLEFGCVSDFKNSKLGWRFSVDNETNTKSRDGLRKTFFANPGNSVTATPGGLEDPKLIGVGNPDSYRQTDAESVTSFNTGVTYDFAENHQIKLDLIYVQNGGDTSYLGQNVISLDSNLVFKGGENATLDDLFFFRGNEYYRERNLTAAQVSGKHDFPSLNDAKISWAAQKSQASQVDYLAETRFASELGDPYANYILSRNTAAPTALTSSWLDNTEDQVAGRMDAVIPRELFNAGRDSELKVGVATDRSERVASGFTDFKSPSNDFTSPDYVTLYKDFIGSSLFSSTSQSYPLSSEATRDIDAVYAGTSLALNGWAKVVGGMRLESFSLASAGGSRWAQLTTNNFYSTEPAAGFGDLLGTSGLSGAEFLAPGAIDPIRDPDGDSIIPTSSEYKSSDPLPGVGLIFEPTKKTTIRLAYSQTMGRPSVREISPYFNRSIESQNLVVGNPALEPSSLNNFDFRFEWNPTAQDGVAVSVFHKMVEDPIEKVILTTVAGDVETWINNPGTAEMTGLEFEFRHGLGRWTDVLSDFSLNGNITFIEASVEEHPLAILAATPDFGDPSKIKTSRRLYDQPEYIANADITWSRVRWGTSATLAVYAVSDTLVASGLTNSISLSPANYDLYQRAYARCDFIFSQRLTKNLKLKFSVKNLLDPELGTIYDREYLGSVRERNVYRAGRDYSLSLSADF